MSKTHNSAPLARLMALPMAERIEAVFSDLSSPRKKFRGVDAHELAEALGVPQADCPGGKGWTFLRYEPIVALEEHAETHSPVSELVHLLEDQVPPKRFEVLASMFSALDDSDAPDFGFLTPEERASLEKAIALEGLEANASNGMNCLAHYSIQTRSGFELRFEAEVEDDGHCIILKTPYDEREGKFADLGACVTEEY